jgi:hypothetical protein
MLISAPCRKAYAILIVQNSHAIDISPMCSIEDIRCWNSEICPRYGNVIDIGLGTLATPKGTVASIDVCRFGLILRVTVKKFVCPA